ncbi:MAG: hypothetical protein NTW69_00310 [Chloroflexi bacterium]|nr:hypothetical protein [Chloroflexota bacterium]
MKETTPKIFWKTFIAATILLSSLAIYQTVQQGFSLDIIIWRSKWIFLLGLFALNIIVGIFALRFLSSENGARWVEKFEFSSFNKVLGFILVGYSHCAFYLLKMVLVGLRNLNLVHSIKYWVLFLWYSVFPSSGC